MKKLYTSFIAVLVLSSVVFAQNEVKPVIYSGSKALLFQFSGLANIAAGDFEGGAGAKFFLTPNLAIRGGLQFMSIKETVPSGAANVADNKQSVTGFGVNAAVEYHLGTKRVSPYIGGGVSFDTRTTEETINNINGSQTINNRFNGVNINGTNYTAGTTFSVFGMLGAEFFLFNELSLGAEYRLGFSSTSAPDEEVKNPNQTITTKGGSTSAIGLQSQGFITLALYF